jgi:ribonuclease R
MAAERESIELDRAYVALEHLGERLRGVIAGVQAFGLFVATDVPFLEGMIPVSTLGDDFYELDDLGTMLHGANSGRVFMLGQALEVEIASVNVARRQIELRLAEAQGDSQRADGAEARARGGGGGGSGWRHGPKKASAQAKDGRGRGGRRFGNAPRNANARPKGRRAKTRR